MITGGLIDRLIQLKKTGKEMPENWKNHLARYIMIKEIMMNRYLEIYDDCRKELNNLKLKEKFLNDAGKD